MPKFRNVTKDNPCSACGRTDWCSYSEKSPLVVCRRNTNGREKHDANGTQYWLHGSPKRRASVHRSATKFRTSTRSAIAGPDLLNAVYESLLCRLQIYDGHRLDLNRRGLSDAEIAMYGYKSLPPRRERTRIARELVEQHGATNVERIPGFYVATGIYGRFWTISGDNGIIIPQRDESKRIVALRLRRYETTESKYIYLSSKGFGGASPGSNLHIPIKNHLLSHNHLRITEGELKADIATLRTHIPTISVPGVSMWSLAIPYVVKRKPDVVKIAFDSDFRTNINVRNALFALVCRLRTLNFSTLVESWS